MTAQGYALFDTPIGQCGIAWRAAQVIGVQFPEARASTLRAELRRRFPTHTELAPPPRIKSAVQRITELLRGRAIDLSSIPLDMSDIPPFHQRVYQSARTIPPGMTLSYGELAARIGKPGAARAVGQALGRNPFAIVVPCHRVLAAGGKIGGFSAPGGIHIKQRLLSIEAAAAVAPTRTEGAPGLAFDAAQALAHLCGADPVLAKLIDRAGPYALEIKNTTSVFAALAQAIVYQQLTGKAAATIFARICALAPKTRGGLRAAHILDLSEAALRSAGLSRSKAAALRDLAQKIVAGSLPTLAQLQRMDDATVIDCLTQVRGIGRWTAEMFLMFRLGRADVLPVDDYGVRKGFALTFKQSTLPTRQQMEQHAARWQPYRSVASWYLWRAVDLL